MLIEACLDDFFIFVDNEKLGDNGGTSSEFTFYFI